MDWIATRDKELLVTEERLRLESTELVVRDSAWQMTRDGWLIEKAEAEQVIRRLLMELGSQHRQRRLNSLFQLKFDSAPIFRSPGRCDSRAKNGLSRRHVVDSPHAG